MAAPPHLPDPPTPWKAIALALAAVSAFLSAVLLVMVAAEPRAPAAGAESKDAAAEESEDSPEKRGKIEGSVELLGTPPLMKVAPERKASEFCKTRPVPADAVVVSEGRLKDVLIR